MKLPFEPQSAANIKHSWLRVLIVGKLGSGKTQLAASVGGPTLVLSIHRDAGHITLQGKENVSYYRFKTWGDAINVVESLYAQRADKGFDLNCVIIDNIDQWCDMLVEELIEAKKKEDAGRDKDSAGRDWGVWNKRGDYMTRLLNMISQLPCHVVYTCHDEKQTIGDGKGGEVIKSHQSRLPTKIGNRLSEQCDPVIYLEQTATVPPRYMSYMTRTGLFFARTRIKGLEHIYEDMDLKRDVIDFLKKSTASNKKQKPKQDPAKTVAAKAEEKVSNP